MDGNFLLANSILRTWTLQARLEELSELRRRKQMLALGFWAIFAQFVFWMLCCVALGLSLFDKFHSCADDMCRCRAASP